MKGQAMVSVKRAGGKTRLIAYMKGQASEVVVVGVDDPAPSTAVMDNSMIALYKILAG